MDLPKRYGDTPIEVELEAGQRYSYCPCGLSQTQPFCDGAHKTAETDFRSIKFTPEKNEKAWLCMCKKTKNPPYCDGSHNEAI
ncbi:MAG: CDGSH iron-sulfur domain-containing protein [Pseudomonadota bacterium]